MQEQAQAIRRLSILKHQEQANESLVILSGAFTCFIQGCQTERLGKGLGFSFVPGFASPFRCFSIGQSSSGKIPYTRQIVPYRITSFLKVYFCNE